MNQPVVTSMRDDYVDEAKQPVGVPARTSSYINTSIYIYIYIAIYIYIQLKACLRTT